jgi:hypothetical protein
MVIGPPMSLRAFAARLGTSHVAIGRALRSGRITRGVVDGKIVDPTLAEEDWRTNLDRTRAPGYVRERVEQPPVRDPSRGGRPPRQPPGEEDDEDTPSLSEASAREKHWKAQMAELRYREAAGELVPAAEVHGKVEKVFRACATRLLAVPSRARQALPHLTLADLAEIERLQREALDELAVGEIVGGG